MPGTNVFSSVRLPSSYSQYFYFSCTFFFLLFVSFLRRRRMSSSSYAATWDRISRRARLHLISTLRGPSTMSRYIPICIIDSVKPTGFTQHFVKLARWCRQFHREYKRGLKMPIRKWMQNATKEISYKGKGRPSRVRESSLSSIPIYLSWCLCPCRCPWKYIRFTDLIPVGFSVAVAL